MQRIQGTASGPGRMLPGELHRRIKRIEQCRINRDQFSRGQIFLHQTQGSMCLPDGGLLAKDLQFERRGQFQGVQRSVDDGLARRAGSDQITVRLRVIQLNQTTRV